MFAFFENRIEPFPAAEPVRPPKGLFAFCWHYSRDAWPWLVAMSVLSALIAISEVTIFGFLGNIVDWLSSANRETFLQDEGWRLAAMGAFVLIVLPALVLLHS